MEPDLRDRLSGSSRHGILEEEVETRRRPALPPRRVGEPTRRLACFALFTLCAGAGAWAEEPAVDARAVELCRLTLPRENWEQILANVEAQVGAQLRQTMPRMMESMPVPEGVSRDELASLVDELLPSLSEDLAKLMREMMPSYEDMAQLQAQLFPATTPPRSWSSCWSSTKARSDRRASGSCRRSRRRRWSGCRSG